MKKGLEFIRRASDVFFYAFLFGMCFSFGAMLVSDRPFRSFACVLICMVTTCLMAMIYVRADKILKATRTEEKREEKAA